jgi:hypothetical protein
MSADQLSSIINPDDFVSMRFVVTFHNLTTNVDVPESATVRIAEFAETGLILELPAKSCALKHNVMIEVKKAPPKNKAPAPAKAKEKDKGKDKGKPKAKDKSVNVFSATGKVIGVEETDTGDLRVAMQFVQWAEDEWKSFMALFQSRQDEISKFLKAAKG